MAKRPVITRETLERFKGDREMLRFLMDLYGSLTTVIDIQNDIDTLQEKAIIFKEVADITSPVELNGLDGELEGNVLIAYDASDEYTIYVYNPTQITENVPYVVDGNTGSWVSSGGGYNNYFSTNYIDFNKTHPGAGVEARLSWNSDDGVLEFGLPGGSVTCQIGTETYTPRAKAFGSDIQNGHVVYVAGASGSRPLMSLAKADSLTTCEKTIAIATETITQNSLGYYTAYGLVRSLDTSAFSNGDPLFLSPTVAGAMTNVRPTSPNYALCVAICIVSHASKGVIFSGVRVLFQLYSSVYGMTATYIPYADANGFMTEKSTLTFDAGNDRLLAAKGRFGGAANYSEFESDGTLAFKGNATVYNDIQFAVSSGKLGVANNPTWQALTTNTSEYGFDVGDYIDLGSNELDHRWEEGSTGDIHMHVSTEVIQAAGADRYAKFTVYIAYPDPTTEVWSETSISAELTIPDGTPALKNFYLDIGDITLTNNSIEDQIKARIERVAATGGTEYPDLIYIHQVGMHIKNDTAGSRAENTK